MGAVTRRLKLRWAERIPQFEKMCDALLPFLYARSRAELSDTARRFSPKKFTQPQLAAIVALKRALFTTYRDIALALGRSERARKMLGLSRVPHYSALYLAEKRLDPALEKIWARTPARTESNGPSAPS